MPTGINIVTDHDQIWKPHVTVASICERNNRFLLVKELINGNERYNQPAGHLEPGETLEQAVIRETLEETSYQFTPTAFLGVYRFVINNDPLNTHIRFSYIGQAGENTQQPLDEGIISVHWMSLDEIHETITSHRSPMVLRCVEDYIQKISYPLEVMSSEFG